MHRKKKMRLRQREERIVIRAAAEAQEIQIAGASEGFELLAEDIAASGDGKPKLKKFAMTAYTGVAMNVGFGSPVVVDLAGMQISGQAKPILKAHDAEQIVGHTQVIEASSQRLKVAGVISGVGEAAKEVVELASNGFPWQASIGASIQKLEFVDQGESVKVNGRNFNGPVYVARQTVLGEVSFVPMGADGNTSASVAASKQEGIDMNFEAWLKAKGFDPATISAEAKTFLKAQFDADGKAPPAPPTPPAAPALQAKASDDSSYSAAWDAMAADAKRRQDIRKLALEAGKNYRGDPDRLNQIRELEIKACNDEKCDARAFELDLLRLSRFDGPMIISGAGKQELTAEVWEAAICKSHRLKGYEEQFEEQTLEAADKLCRNGLSLKRMLLAGARSSGYDGDESDFAGVCRAIVRGSGIKAGVGPSTGVQVPGILGNTGNKFLAASFMNVEQSWRGIAKIRPVNDFKQITTYRMSGDNTFLRVAPSGEIKHGALAETSYTNQAKTFGRLLGISREDYINDDLQAFVSVAQELGRGAADALNNIFWTAWLDDSTFFPVDKSKLNYDDGAADSVLDLAGLNNADSMFAIQTKPDGTPLGATPKILLVPAALKNTALALMTNTGLVVGTTPASGPNVNVFAGRYTVVSSAFLHRTTLKDENGVSQSVTGSSTAWYMLADPMDIPCIEVVFLNGRDTPTIEQGEFEFERLGLATRAYFDFGVSKQEYRGGVKMKGAA